MKDCCEGESIDTSFCRSCGSYIRPEDVCFREDSEKPIVVCPACKGLQQQKIFQAIRGFYEQKRGYKNLRKNIIF
jgi:ribosomal protein L32